MILSSHLGIKMTDKTPYYPKYPTDIEFDLLNQIRRFQFYRGFSNSSQAADFVFSTVSKLLSQHFKRQNLSFFKFFSLRLYLMVIAGATYIM